MGITVGIDLGTTFSAVAYVPRNSSEPQIIPNAEGKKITPSIICFDDDRIVFGSEAEDEFKSGELNCAATFKRYMGTNEIPFYHNGKEYTSEYLSYLLLKHLKEDAEASLNDKIDEAVITVPAYFESPPRESTIRAAQMAGIKVKKLIDEPNAAALAYGISHWRENANILVYDLGGGTFDVTLVHMSKGGVLSSVVTRGDHKLGGRDWDNEIKNILLDKFEDATDVDLSEDCEFLGELEGVSEGLKKELSSINQAKVSLYIKEVNKRISVNISREEFESASEYLINMTGALCKAVLNESGLKTDDITDVLLVGGSTRMPQVRNYLEKMFGKKPLSHVNPDEAVALGAAIQATKSENKYAELAVVVKDGKKITDHSSLSLVGNRISAEEKRISNLSLISLKETTAHAMGVVSFNDEKNVLYNEIIIPSNHERPVRSAKRFRFITSPYKQNVLEIYVLQGSDEDPFKCMMPYKFTVDKIRHVKDGDTLGTVMRIQYSYDGNGIMHVQARQESDNVDLPIRKDEVPENKNSLIESLMESNRHMIVHKYRSVTFSNAKWVKYDNVNYHRPAPEYNEPPVHVIATDENIEFHGYNISEMNEGVYYELGVNDGFEIDCDINTSTISPHPGGCLNIKLGIVTASLNESGGNILFDGEIVAVVPSKFNLKMVAEGSRYQVLIDKVVVFESDSKQKITKVDFGFTHASHNCSLLSHAYITGIKMRQWKSGDDGNSDTEIWDN